jgi:hypothetical protein
MKKFTFKIEIEISEQALELLKKVDEAGFAEYRDCEFDTYRDYVYHRTCKGLLESIRSEESFNSRNFGGTWLLMEELVEGDLMEHVDDAWHTTYKVGEWGSKVLESLKEEQV